MKMISRMVLRMYAPAVVIAAGGFVVAETVARTQTTFSGFSSGRTASLSFPGGDRAGHRLGTAFQLATVPLGIGAGAPLRLRWADVAATVEPARRDLSQVHRLRRQDGNPPRALSGARR